MALPPIPCGVPRIFQKRADIRAARVETRLRRWALIGFIVAAALFWLATLFFR